MGSMSEPGLEYPKLRRLEIFPVKQQGQDFIALSDPEGYLRDAVLLSPVAFFVSSLCDGKRSVRDLQTAYVRRFGDIITSSKIEEMLQQFDERLLLDTERYRSLKRRFDQEYLALPNRPMTRAGAAYAAQPRELLDQLSSVLSLASGPEELEGLPRAVVAPHIDLARGARCYGEIYSLLFRSVRRQPPQGRPLIVILGTCHGEMEGPFALTSKNYLTPLGLVETDIAAATELARGAEMDGMGDELSHRSEHSIEIQLPFLVALMGGPENFTALPVTCNAFIESLEARTSPREDKAIAAFTAALGELVASRPEVMLLASADLAHVGPRFGGRLPVDKHIMVSVGSKDREMLARVEEGDAEGFFSYVAAEGDARHICGLSPIYTLAKALAAPSRLVHYEQWVEPDGNSAVTFAALVS